MAVLEDQVLQSLGPLQDNPDDWPTFCLRRVKVESQATGQLVSLLSAHKANPVTVSGRLDEVEEDHQKLIRVPNYRSKTIELKDVKTYAFAEYEDKTFGFWAAGKAGWFEVEGCATAYKDIHKQMTEACSILYFLADRVRKESKVKPKTSRAQLEKHIERVCSDYSNQRGDLEQFADAEDVRNALHDHREFLITSMLEGQEQLDWKDTPALNYFKLHFSEDVSRINSKIPQPISRADLHVTPTLLAPPPQTTPTNHKQSVDNARKRKSPSPHEQDVKQPKRRGRRPRGAQAEEPKTPAHRSRQVLTADVDEDEDEDEADTTMTHKRKSILRPPGSKSAKKAKGGPGRKRTRPGYEQPILSDSDEDEGNAEDDDGPIVTIENGDHLEAITNPPPPKNTRTLDKEEESRPTFLPRKYLELSVNTYEIPTTQPQGPGDLWTCSFEGCHRREHQASTAEGQERVRAHLRTHVVNGGGGTDAKEKIDLVLDESRPYLPVNNLVRKLQAFAPDPDQEPSKDSIQRKFSAPTRRRY